MPSNRQSRQNKAHLDEGKKLLGCKRKKTIVGWGDEVGTIDKRIEMVLKPVLKSTSLLKSPFWADYWGIFHWKKEFNFCNPLGQIS